MGVGANRFTGSGFGGFLGRRLRQVGHDRDRHRVGTPELLHRGRLEQDPDGDQRVDDGQRDHERPADATLRRRIGRDARRRTPNERERRARGHGVERTNVGERGRHGGSGCAGWRPGGVRRAGSRPENSALTYKMRIIIIQL
jgi:hypothetical protein